MIDRFVGRSSRNIPVLVPAIAMLVMCGLAADAAAASAPEVFGKTKDGQVVHRFTLQNRKGVVARLITRGATLTELHVPDKRGKTADVVLGFDTVAGYESKDNQYFGCTVGRVCNRIAKGRFTLNGKTYQLALNDGPNHLHGGVERSWDKVVWKGRYVKTKHGPGVRFEYTSPDGEEGYPGTVKATVVYALNDENELRIDFMAETDAPTPVNMTNHSYFNLQGAGAPTVLDHVLTIDADYYTPTDETLIPTGEIAPVDGTPLDFRKPHRIGERIEPLIESPSLGYDHNFVLNGQPGKLRFAARLHDPRSGRILEVLTTQPGLQFYSGNFLFGQKGKGGKTYAKRSAVCLETQHFPDSPNHPEFPSIILKPGQRYHEVCVYRFRTE